MAITLDDIKIYNPALSGEKFEVPEFKREIYHSIKEMVEERRFIVALTGLRRIGKTTILKQIYNEIQGDKFFFSFEEDRFANYDALKEVIELFIRMGNKPTIFLDELGRVKGWVGLLKKYHDLNLARFVISGSSALQLSKGKESLAGRIMEYTISSWQFNEFLHLNGVKADSIRISGFDEIEKEYIRWNRIGEDKVIEFLKKGSFPELYDISDENQIKRYIKSTTLEKIIFEDIPHVFAVEDKSKLFDIMSYIGRESGSIVKYSHLGESLEMSKDTVKKYIFYLKSSYLVDILPVERSTLRSMRKLQKIYASCSPISYALSDSYNENRLVETAVFDKMKNSFVSFSYFRDVQKHEVNFVGRIVVESKWKKDITSDDLSSLFYYMKKRNIENSIVVGKEFDVVEKQDKKIFILPLPFFLLCDFSAFK
jgi:predicted AAA+ superfamily ATPase